MVVEDKPGDQMLAIGNPDRPAWPEIIDVQAVANPARNGRVPADNKMQRQLSPQTIGVVAVERGANPIEMDR